MLLFIENVAVILLVLWFIKALGWAFERPWVGYTLLMALIVGGAIVLEHQ